MNEALGVRHGLQHVQHLAQMGAKVHIHVYMHYQLYKFIRLAHTFTGLDSNFSLTSFYPLGICVKSSINVHGPQNALQNTIEISQLHCISRYIKF